MCRMNNNRSDKNRIRILMTSDVHGKIFPHSYANGERKDIGFGRLYKAIEKLRDESTVLIDNGDVLEGSPLQLYHMMTDLRDEKPSPVSVVMGKMKYDYINLGNHDFNFGPEVLFRHINETGAVCITSNISYEGEPLPKKVKGLTGRALNPAEERSYELIEVSGKKLAIFGLITHFVPHWESDEHLKGFRFHDALESAKAIVKEIKDEGKADYIVCVYHGGFEMDPESGESIGQDTGENQGYLMLKEIPEIDVLLTGHQHRLMVGHEDGRAYVQPGVGGEYIACVDIYPEVHDSPGEIDCEQKAKIEAKVIRIEDDEDESLLDLVRDEEGDCQIWLDSIIGKTNVDLRIEDEFHARLNKSQLITYFNNIQMKRSGADVSAVALFQGATGLGPDITIRQIVSTYIFPDNIVVKRINGKILKEYLEKDMEFWAVEEGRIIVNPAYEIPNPQYFNYDLLDGIEYTARISNPVGERIVSLTRGGIPVTDDMELSIAINHYRSAGGGEFFMLSDAETVFEDSVTMIDILVDEIRENGLIDFLPVNNIKIEV